MPQSDPLDILPIGLETEKAEDTEEDRADKKPARGVRRRVAQACDRCRIRKDKCEAQKPICSNCAENGRQCSYDMVAKKRGLPEGYVRGLEKLWGLAIKDIEDVEELMLSVLDNSVGSRASFDWDDRKTSDKLVKSWRQSQLSQELGRLLSDRGPVIETVKRGRLDSEPTPAKRLRINQSFIEEQVGKQNGAGDTNRQWKSAKPEGSLPTSSNSPMAGIPDGNHTSSIAYDSILQPSYTQWSASNSIPRETTALPDLPSETWHLLDVYFSYTHSWLPILIKHDVLRTSYQYSQSQHNPSSRGSGSGEYAALWAAIALAKFQHRAINNIPLAQGPVADMVWTAERMYNQARALIPNEEGDLDIGHVQALLILTVANMGMGHFSRAWSLVGQAVRLSFDLELQKPLDHVLAASRQKSTAKYVFLGCFVLDTLLAARLERRPHLRSDDIDLVGYAEEDGLEEWDPWNDSLAVRKGSTNSFRGPAALASTFNRLVQVLQILNQTTCLPDHAKSPSTKAILLQKLETWNQSQQTPIPSASYGKHSENSTSLLPHQYHLHAAYFATLVTIRLLGRKTPGDKEDMECCLDSARQVVGVFNEEANSFNLVIVPPTYECFATAVYDCVQTVEDSLENRHVAIDNLRHNMDNCLDAMEPAWPVFSPFKEQHCQEPRHLTKTESQVAYELMTSGRRSSGSSRATRGHRGSTISEIKRASNIASTPHRSSSASNMVGGLDSDPKAAGDILQQISQQILPAAWRISASNHVALAPESRHFQSNSNTYIPETSSINSTTQPHLTPTDMSQQLDPQLLDLSPSASTNINADPLFNEFATIDAVEWTDNWDNFLVNLGFNDPDKMNHDFITMSREPELPNDIFQQLVSNSPGDGVGVLGGNMTSQGGMSSGFEMFDFGEENEGYEAGQILQSLSLAGEMELFKNIGA